MDPTNMVPTTTYLAPAVVLPGWLQRLDPTDPLTLVGAVALLEFVWIILLAAGNRRLRARLGTARQDPGGRVEGSPLAELASLYEKALTGSLDRFSVTDVIQFLNSIQETGILDITDKAAGTVYRMVVAGGEIIDAFDGEKRGEEAVSAIVTCNQGTFTFIRGDVSAEAKTVGKPTMTLLMESMQSLDESGVNRDPDPPNPLRIG